MIDCRRATKNDVELFKEVRLKALKDSPDAFGSTYESALQRDHGSWRDQLFLTTTGGDRNTQFAFSGEQCVGIAALYRETSLLEGELIMMWVDPEYRGTDAASLLVNDLLSWAKDSGLDTVYLEVTDSNARAIKFYTNLGFCDSGETVEIDSDRNLHGIRMIQRLG